jgi:hypothetical protein
LRRCAKYFSTPRAENCYATHVPILIGIAGIREVRNVLEFGCGMYSTLTFLNAAVFRHLERLESVENDAAWAETIQETAKSDARWTLTLIDGEISDAVSTLDLEAFDLILIDDSQTSEQRVCTIREVSKRAPHRPWVLIHDFEVADYRRAAAGFRQGHRFKAYNPNTGLLWNSTTHARRAKSIDRIVKAHAKTLDPNDIPRWLNAFS